jgi:phage shock protein C
VTPRRLFRTHDRQLAGVAGGMAEYLDVDPTIIRILWILGAIFSGGLLILAYIILAFVIPQAPYGSPAAAQGWAPPAQGWAPPAGPGSQPAAGVPSWGPDWAARAEAERRAQARSRGRGPGAGVIVGVILVVFGAIALADSVLPGWVDGTLVGPALIIALGAALLVGAIARTDDDRPAASVAGTAPATGWEPAAPATDEAFGAYDAEATAPVDLDLPATPVDRQPDTDPR